VVIERGGRHTITKLRASDLSDLQVISTGVNPIGITYDATTGDIWVAIDTGRSWFSLTGRIVDVSRHCPDKPVAVT